MGPISALCSVLLSSEMEAWVLQALVSKHATTALSGVSD